MSNAEKNKSFWDKLKEEKENPKVNEKDLKAIRKRILKIKESNSFVNMFEPGGDRKWVLFCELTKEQTRKVLLWNIIDKLLNEVYNSHPQIQYTKKEILQEAKKYNTRVKFEKDSPLVYRDAVRKNIVADSCRHMLQYKKDKYNRIKDLSI